MMSKAFDYIGKSVNYEAYNEAFYAKAHASTAEMNEQEKEMHAYHELNWARSSRVSKVYSPSESAIDALHSMKDKQIWIVITEGWCGDSAQSLPVIAALADASNGKITLHIVSRDMYPELLEEYRTNGSMSIPKLIACDSSGKELWTWGPRPISAQVIFDELKSQNADKQDIYKAVHGFYAKDKGQSIEAELIVHSV